MKKTRIKKQKTVKKNLKKIVLDESKLEKAVEEISEEKERPEETGKLGSKASINLNEFNSLNLKNFLETATKTTSPTLERVSESEPGPRFFRIPGGGTGANNITENAGEFKYVPGANTTNEPKYLGSDSRIVVEPKQINIRETGKMPEPISNIDQEIFFERASEQKDFNSQSVERFERAERFDAEKAGRKESFSREETKYEKYKPKLPKSW